MEQSESGVLARVSSELFLAGPGASGAGCQAVHSARGGAAGNETVTLKGMNKPWPARGGSRSEWL